MASPQQVPQIGGLGAQLRALRREYPTLAVLTEIIQLDERRVTFRATVHIDGEVRAQGHAALGADPAGAFVAAAERLAVEQALLLGGFGPSGEEMAAPDEQASPPLTHPIATATPGGSSSLPADGQDYPVSRRRRRRGQQPVAQPSAGGIEREESAVVPEMRGAEGSQAQALSPAQLPAADDVVSADSPHSPFMPPSATTIPASPNTPEVVSPAPRRRRDRSAERERARSRQSTTETGANAATGRDQMDPIDPAATNGTSAPAEEQQPVSEQPPLRGGEQAAAVDQPPPGNSPAGETKSDAPELPTPAPLRRVRARAATNQQAVPAPPEEPGTLEAIRADWRAGRPIPAWWPPERIAVEKPLSKPQVERLRTVALGEEITAAQLDSYSTMLFGSVVAKLSQAQGTILEERLNPAYPSPLQELSARRVLHPIAVGDSVSIPDGQAAFIRWRDVPPAEETPPTPSWRAGGAKKSRNRRR